MLWRALVLWLCLALPLVAQQSPPAVLVADDIFITADRVLIARGNVEAFQDGTRLAAQEIRYDPANGRLLITGPITVEDGNGAVILADQGQMDQDLQNGILRGARLVLDEQLQLASVELARVGGRYSQLYKTAITSCTVCEGDTRPPLWQIRARRVVHDAVERQIYLDGAQLRIRSIPVFYLPRLRLPDPTLARSTGFLIPSIQSTTQLGTGLKLPYFIKLGDHRDLTLTPYLSRRTRTLELRYRQAFGRGRIELNGAVTGDDLRPGETRGYLFATGQFRLPRDLTLAFDLKSTSDLAYLKDYGVSNADRLISQISLHRARRDQYGEVTLTHVRSLRDDETNSTLPGTVVDGYWERRLFPRATGGEVRLALNAHGHLRTSDLDVDGPDPDAIVDGRDVVRLSASADWRRSWLMGGLETQAQLGLAADTFSVTQDATFSGRDSRLLPSAALSLRYPLRRTTGGGATQILEPIAQLAWSDDIGLDVPNEESTNVEFDEGNLLSLSRFPAPDRRETGTQAALGLSWTHLDPAGREASLTFGRVFRTDADGDLTMTSGLSGTSSSYLVAGQLRFANGLDLTGRALVDDGLDVNKAELRGGWSGDGVLVAGSLVWLAADTVEDRPNDVAELTLDGRVRLSPVWTATGNMRFDFETGRAATSGIGFLYANECVRVGLDLRRRFTSSTSVEPTTSVGLTVALQGFATRPGTEKYKRACGRTAS